MGLVVFKDSDGNARIFSSYIDKRLKDIQRRKKKNRKQLKNGGKSNSDKITD